MIKPYLPCPVCGEHNPEGVYCSNDCQSLDKSKWRDGVTEQDVVASLIGEALAGKYLPTIVKQIDYIYTQEKL